jgi:hypothetical protein
MFARNWNAPHLIKPCFERLKMEMHFINSGVYMPYLTAEKDRDEMIAEYRWLEAKYGGNQ